MRNAMRKGGRAAGLVLAMLAGTGCAAMSNTEKGALLGGLAGAGIGRAIGHHNGSEARGGFAGAGIGALVGGLFGALADREEEHRTVPAVHLDPPVRSAPRVHEYDLPPVPEPRRTVRRTTTTTTTVVREAPVERRRVVWYEVDDCD